MLDPLHTFAVLLLIYSCNFRYKHSFIKVCHVRDVTELDKYILLKTLTVSPWRQTAVSWV